MKSSKKINTAMFGTIDLFANNKHAYENIFIPLPSKASGQVIFL